MWCQNCQQDVPGVNGSQLGAVRCVRCGSSIQLDSAARDGLRQDLDYTADHGVNIETSPEPAQATPDLDFENWDLEREIRKLRGLSAGQSLLGQAKRFTIIHQSHIPTTTSGDLESDLPSRGQHGKPQSTPQQPSSGRFAATVLFGSVAAIIGGGVLMLTGNFTSTGALGIYGVPLLGYGQIGLMLGLVLQLDRVTHVQRTAANRIEKIQSQLTKVEQTTCELSATRGSVSQAFYTHMVDGASPQVLLADLKGQLDLLAAKLAR